MISLKLKRKSLSQRNNTKIGKSNISHREEMGKEEVAVDTEEEEETSKTVRIKTALIRIKISLTNDLNTSNSMNLRDLETLIEMMTDNRLIKPQS